LHVLSAQLAFHGCETRAQFERGNGFVVHDGNDAIDLDRLRAPLAAAARPRGSARIVRREGSVTLDVRDKPRNS
jgi:hypothetical protein